jgi:superfamily I DNA and/or RNA helicase
MNQKQVWEKFITAQSKILEHKSKPIGIDTGKSIQINGMKMNISIDQEIFKQVFKKEVEAIFNIQNFDFENGYIQTSLANTVNITTEKISQLKALADICYIDFNENPVIDGYISQKNNLNVIVNYVYEKLNILIPIRRLKEEKAIYLTMEEKLQIDSLNFVQFEDTVKAKFNISPVNENDNVFKILNDLYKTLDNNIYRTSKRHCTISFLFNTLDEYNNKLKVLKDINSINIVDRGIDQKYKFTINYQNKLMDLRNTIDKCCPNLITKIVERGEKLIFRQFYKTESKTEILSRLKNQLNDIVNLELFEYGINDNFQVKYLCEENFKLKVEQEEEKLSKLLRTDFFVCDESENKLFEIGTLTKVEYPHLIFTVQEENIDTVNQRRLEIQSIKPDLKGERDKIKRLEDTIIKLEDEKTKLPNDNAKVFLFDSSKAKRIKNIDYLLNKTCVEWQEFENNLFSKTLNESQKQAIYKSLYAEELSLIQGPPGTGKSTAIAEIIWQHIRKEPKQKILLTSETNLAVDNAIDRLKNGRNNVVKPIRFGNSENLESEGYFYTLEAIEDWQKINSTQSNTVSHWINNIVNRISNQEDEQINSALEKWKKYLQMPNCDTKKLFADKYLEYVNLIGATGSSIGKLNSENKWTSFFRSYLNVFHKKHFENKNYEVLNNKKISFDTIVMDEASKATPPELALPVLFGKKSIIVGDHRQLPPMIDGEEIKDILNSIGEKSLAKTLSHKEFETSQFERLFLNIDDSIKGTFDTQYRMHPAINNVIAQFYENDGGLKCGLPLEESFHNSFLPGASRYHGLKFKDKLTPETHTIWVNVKTPEIQEGTSRVNFGEIKAIDNILNVLKNSEGKNEFDNWLSNKSQEEKQIGLISFYGKQINYLERMLLQSHKDLYYGKGKENDKKNLIRLSTVDRFQGMERNIIIASMVRSNKQAAFQGQDEDFNIYPELGYPKQDSLGFAESPNRLNVALSRARRLLIVVGNGEHFCRKDIYKNVFKTIQQNGIIISAEELQNAVEQNG